MTTCSSCPFNCSEESERVINYGCVPTISEIMELKQNHNVNWGCHSKDKLCSGFVEFCKEEKIDYKSGKLLSYQDWYNGVRMETNQERELEQSFNIETCNWNLI